MAELLTLCLKSSEEVRKHLNNIQSKWNKRVYWTNKKELVMASIFAGSGHLTKVGFMRLWRINASGVDEIYLAKLTACVKNLIDIVACKNLNVSVIFQNAICRKL